MTDLIVLAIDPSKTVSRIAEHSNSWGWSPLIWDAMAIRYLDVPYYMALFLRHNNYEKLWALCHDKTVKAEHRAVHLMTMDYKIIEQKDYKRAANDIRTFISDFSMEQNVLNHLTAIADLFESNPDHAAIGFHVTHSDNLFIKYCGQTGDRSVVKLDLDSCSVYRNVDR